MKMKAINLGPFAGPHQAAQLWKQHDSRFRQVSERHVHVCECGSAADHISPVNTAAAEEELQITNQ